MASRDSFKWFFLDHLKITIETDFAFADAQFINITLWWQGCCVASKFFHGEAFPLPTPNTSSLNWLFSSFTMFCGCFWVLWQINKRNSLILFSWESFSIKDLCSMVGLARPISSVPVYSGYLFIWIKYCWDLFYETEEIAPRFLWWPVETLRGQICC